jgi:hypothetical protein
MKTIAKIFIASFILIFVIPFVSLAANPSETNINVLSTPFGTGSYVLSAALEEIAKKSHPWLRITHSESPGQIFNVRKLDKEPESRKDTIVTSGPGVSWLGKQGFKPFEEKHEPLKLIGNYYSLAVWLATLNPNIKGPNELIGKKIALGRIAQIVWAVQPEWIIRVGWGIKDKTSVEYIGMGESITALLDGTVDAGIIGGYIDPIQNRVSMAPQTMELMASGRKIHHVSWGSDAVVKAASEMGNSIVPYTMPAGSVQGLENPLDVFVDSVSWCAAPEFPEELAYEVTKLLINNISKFGEYSDLGKLMSAKGLVFGWKAEQIHPGALKAYREAGLIE